MIASTMTSPGDAERIVELEEDNRRLRRLLDRQGAPGELRHRLRGTLALLRAIIRKSAETPRDLPAYVAQLEDRLDAVIRAQAFADQHGKIDLRALLAEEFFQYKASEGERLVLAGPDIALSPKTGQILALALHELAINAVEHGALGTDEGRVEVSWHLAAAQPGQTLVLSWLEYGPAPQAPPAPGGFGTEVLTRLLRYDLNAETQIAFAPDGLSCTIRLPLPRPELPAEPPADGQT